MSSTNGIPPVWQNMQERLQSESVRAKRSRRISIIRDFCTISEPEQGGTMSDMMLSMIDEDTEYQMHEQ